MRDLFVEVENFMFLIVPPSSDNEISVLFVLIELLRLVSGSGLISTFFSVRLVSYTNLTLPTILRVYTSVDDVALILKYTY